MSNPLVQKRKDTCCGATACVRALTPINSTAFLSLVSAAFAIGQFGGPAGSAVLGLLPGGHGAALGRALQLAAHSLTLSGVYLWQRSRAILRGNA